jgi:hypothetical protein
VLGLAPAPGRQVSRQAQSAFLDHRRGRRDEVEVFSAHDAVKLERHR